MGGSFLYQLFPHRKGHQGGVLADHKQVQHVAVRGGGLHQVLVAQGEGVGVHHHRAHPLSGKPGLFRLRQKPLQIPLESALSVLHEHHLALHPGDLVKSQVLKKQGGIALGVEEQVQDATAVLIVDQVADHLI